MDDRAIPSRRLETLAKLSKATGLTFDLHVANGAVEIVQVAKVAATAAAQAMTQAHGSHDEIDELLRILPTDTTVETG
ncbi:hypothetical protein [Protofrankia symbiont of Coriaria ruscifolia]|uniref:hypothetical protein n=1 Tax=Protofrankia symbiont of Coriaria ruscifolia TaxID=1306542 RepID=UPI001041BCC6|nr:hypothetical protein [Protofrankia symbiont of Coriaria ruscifolia]